MKLVFLDGPEGCDTSGTSKFATVTLSRLRFTYKEQNEKGWSKSTNSGDQDFSRSRVLDGNILLAANRNTAKLD